MTGPDVLIEPIGLHRLLAGIADCMNFSDVPITGLGLDSRSVGPGQLFAALHGHTLHGLRFAKQAIQRGCAAIIFDPAGDGQSLALSVSAVPCVPIVGLNRKLGIIADRFFRGPSRHLFTLGITGTNGKTSCSHFLAEALLSAGESAAVLGTLGWGKPGLLRLTTQTTADAISTQAMLYQLKSEGFSHVAMEASSHGLEQGRLDGVHFRGALFINISRDHLDYHGTMEAYLKAKMRLLDWPSLEFVVFNANDAIGNAVLECLPRGIPAIGFAVGGELPEALTLLRVSSVIHTIQGVSFEARYREQTVGIKAPVFGDFNVENLTAVLAVLLAMGYELREGAQLLSHVQAVPGRMESYTMNDRTAVVDYAHTPEALGSVLRSLRSHCTGRLWVVFGCGGDRDRGKRPLMGAVATAIADVAILTDDNPRSEEGDAIIADILSGCGDAKPIVRRDRRQAIRHALTQSQPGDLVLVAGKGHETYQEVRGTKTLFSDRDVVIETLNELGWMAT